MKTFYVITTVFYFIVKHYLYGFINKHFYLLTTTL